MATKRARRIKRRPWSKEDVRALRAHSRSKSPVKKIVRARNPTGGARRKKAPTLGWPLGQGGEVRPNLSAAETNRGHRKAFGGGAVHSPRPPMASTVRRQRRS